MEGKTFFKTNERLFFLNCSFHLHTSKMKPTWLILALASVWTITKAEVQAPVDYQNDSTNHLPIYNPARPVYRLHQLNKENEDLKCAANKTSRYRAASQSQPSSLARLTKEEEAAYFRQLEAKQTPESIREMHMWNQIKSLDFEDPIQVNKLWDQIESRQHCGRRQQPSRRQLPIEALANELADKDENDE